MMTGSLVQDLSRQPVLVYVVDGVPLFLMTGMFH